MVTFWLRLPRALTYFLTQRKYTPMHRSRWKLQARTLKVPECALFLTKRKLNLRLRLGASMNNCNNDILISLTRYCAAAALFFACGTSWALPEDQNQQIDV